MTDKSPRLRAALRYMVYGRKGVFDAENLIDLLQALEKFSAVRDDGDGSAFKVDGVRGNKVVGSAGDFVGSQKVDMSERDTDIGGGRFRVSGAGNGGSLVQAQGAPDVSTSNDEKTVREALRFFFSPEGGVFREFMLEEIVTVVDASSRDAVQELVRSLGLSNLPVPSFFRALNPALSDQDRIVSLPWINRCPACPGSINRRPACPCSNRTFSNILSAISRDQMVQQIRKLSQFLLGDFEGAATSTRLRKLIPAVREYAPQLRDFGILLGARLTEKSLSRGMNWASERLLRADGVVGGSR